MTDNADVVRKENWQTRALNWFLLIAAGTSAVALPSVISRYQEGASGVAPVIGNVSMIAVWGLNKWSRILERRADLAQMSADIADAKTALEDEVENLESQLGSKPQDRARFKL